MYTSDKLLGLVTKWREEAQMLRERFADEKGARIIEIRAEEIEEALHNKLEQTVNLTRAAQLSGYSAGHLRRLVSEGVIPNHGRPGAPRVRPSDLPIKAGGLHTERPPLQLYHADSQQTARSIVNSIK